MIKKLKIQLIVILNFYLYVGNSHLNKQIPHQACIDVSFLLLPIWTS